MQLLGRANDRIDGACLNAKGAADAHGFVDEGGHSAGFRNTVSGIEWLSRDIQQPRQLLYSLLTARRALVDIGTACGNCFGVGPTSRKATLTALRLRQ